MTEYDYSPEAYERYLAKQNAISQWVDHTNHHIPVNPFLPSEAAEPRSPEPTRRVTRRSTQDEYQGDHHSSSRHRSRPDERDSHRRLTYDRYDSYQSRKNSRSSSSPPSRSNSYPYGQYRSSHGQHQYQYNSPTTETSNPYGSSSSTPLSSPAPRTPYEQPPPNQPALIPINGGAGGYFLVPAKGVSYQVVQPQSSSPIQPWYKRMFSPTSSVANGQNRRSKSGSSGRGDRRSSKRGWDIY